MGNQEVFLVLTAPLLYYISRDRKQRKSQTSELGVLWKGMLKMKRDTALHQETGYIVTRDGHVLTKNSRKYKKTYYTHGGYERVRVGVNKNKLVHVMVFEAFSGWRVNTKYYEVHHIDRNPKNNRYENLIMLDKSTHKLIHMLSPKEREILLAEMLDFNFYADD